MYFTKYNVYVYVLSFQIQKYVYEYMKFNKYVEV